MTLSLSDVVMIPFPFSDLQTVKRRPVLVLREADRYGDFLAAAVTSKAGHVNAVGLQADDFSEGVLPKASWVRADKLYTLNESSALFVCARLNVAAFSRVRSVICAQLDC